MKYLIIVLVGFCTNLLSSQTTFKSNPDFEKKFIQEVFQNNISPGTQHYKNLLILLQDRVEFVKELPIKGEKYPKISQMPLFNKYNSQLERDVEFDPNSFNVLKYDLNFFSSFMKVYRFDNSDWIIIVHPKS